MEILQTYCAERPHVVKTKSHIIIGDETLCSMSVSRVEQPKKNTTNSSEKFQNKKFNNLEEISFATIFIIVMSFHSFELSITMKTFVIAFSWCSLDTISMIERKSR